MANTKTLVGIRILVCVLFLWGFGWAIRPIVVAMREAGTLTAVPATNQTAPTIVHATTTFGRPAQGFELKANLLYDDGSLHIATTVVPGFNGAFWTKERATEAVSRLQSHTPVVYVSRHSHAAFILSESPAEVMVPIAFFHIAGAFLGLVYALVSAPSQQLNPGPRSVLRGIVVLCFPGWLEWSMSTTSWSGFADALVAWCLCISCVVLLSIPDAWRVLNKLRRSIQGGPKAVSQQGAHLGVRGTMPRPSCTTSPQARSR
jgi:hypothetical protein